MYISPFVCGIVTTILVEIALIIVGAITGAFTKEEK